MGILNKLSKKTEKEQLEALEKDAPVKSVEKKKAAPKKAAAKKTTKKGKTSKAYKVIVSPLVSEKATVLEGKGQYVFAVDVKATKDEIKDAIEELYGVRPQKLNVLNYEGKRVRFGYTRGRRKDWKKAVAILPKGRTISTHEGV